MTKKVNVRGKSVATKTSVSRFSKNIKWLPRIFALLPSTVFLIYFVSLQNYPKIFADELNGIDTVRRIFDSAYPNYTAYSIGLGLLLAPFYFFTQSPELLYRIGLFLNIAAVLLALFVTYYVLVKARFKRVNLSLFLASIFSGTLVHATRLMTESISFLYSSIALLKFQRMSGKNLTPKKFDYFLSISIGFFGVIHVRLLALIIPIFILNVVLDSKGSVLTQRVRLYVVEFASVCAFQFLNFKIKGTSGGSTSYITEPFRDLGSFVTDGVKVFLGHLIASHLSSMGVLLIALIYFLLTRGMIEKQKRDVFLFCGFLLGMSILVSTYFITSISEAGTYGVTVENTGLATRYFDPFLPIALAVSLSICFEEINIPRLHKRKAILGLTIINGFVFLIIPVFAFRIEDPVRSPLIFGITGGTTINHSSVLFLMLAMWILALLWIERQIALVASVLFIFFLGSTYRPIMWSQGIELGYTKNHEIPSFINLNLDVSTEIGSERCIQYVSRNPNNWATAGNYQFWTKYPIYQVVELNDCRFLITDVKSLGEGYRLLKSEEQFSTFFLYDTKSRP
jgi:hypothetical protein